MSFKFDLVNDDHLIEISLNSFVNWVIGLFEFMICCCSSIVLVVVEMVEVGDDSGEDDSLNGIGNVNLIVFVILVLVLCS